MSRAWTLAPAVKMVDNGFDQRRLNVARVGQVEGFITVPMLKLYRLIAERGQRNAPVRAGNLNHIFADMTGKIPLRYSERAVAM